MNEGIHLVIIGGSPFLARRVPSRNYRLYDMPEAWAEATTSGAFLAYVGEETFAKLIREITGEKP